MSKQQQQRLPWLFYDGRFKEPEKNLIFDKWWHFPSQALFERRPKGPNCIRAWPIGLHSVILTLMFWFYGAYCILRKACKRGFVPLLGITAQKGTPVKFSEWIRSFFNAGWEVSLQVFTAKQPSSCWEKMFNSLAVISHSRASAARLNKQIINVNICHHFPYLLEAWGWTSTCTNSK